METITLKAQVRDPKTETVDVLREAGLLPVECYGRGKENLHLKVNYQDFRRAYIKAGASTLIDLEVEGGDTVKVLVHELQFHPTSEKITHVDLRLINMKEKVTAMVPVRLEGEAPAIKLFGGVLVHSKDEVEVRALPADLPHEIVVDITVLAEIHDSVKIADLKLSDKVEILDSPDQVIASITTASIEEAPVEETPAEGEAAAPAEGEAAPAAEESKNEK